MRSCFVIAAGIAACSVVLGLSSSARAESVIGADFKLAVPVGDKDLFLSSLGVGFDARYGYRIGLGPVYLQPEAQVGYERFAFSLPGGVEISNGPTGIGVLQVVGGARFGLDGPIQPNVFLHAGYAGITQANSASGLVIDAGAAIDFKLIPVVSFGAELGFTDFIASSNGVSESIKWVHFGPEAALHF